MRHRCVVLFLGIGLLAALPACNDDGSPSSPSGGNTGGGGTPTPGGDTGGGGTPQPNQPPIGVFNIFPKPNGNSVTGRSPFTVSLNMCGSTDPDPGDDLRYEFWFNGREGEPDQIGACKVERTYRLGSATHLCFDAVTCVWDRQPLADHRVCKTWKVCLDS